MKNEEPLFPAQLPHDIPEQKIREALADFDQVEWASLALKTLNQRLPEKGLIEARNILKDTKAPERIRSVASVELGKHSDAASGGREPVVHPIVGQPLYRPVRVVSDRL